IRASRRACSWKLPYSRFARGPRTRRKEHLPFLRSVLQSSRGTSASETAQSSSNVELHPDSILRQGDFMANENIFSGLKVVELASFIAGPAAATILSDFDADVIKVEPPNGELWRHGQKIPPQPHSEEAYPFQLANRNKRGVTLNLK